MAHIQNRFHKIGEVHPFIKASDLKVGDKFEVIGCGRKKTKWGTRILMSVIDKDIISTLTLPERYDDFPDDDLEELAKLCKSGSTKVFVVVARRENKRVDYEIEYQTV